MASGERNRSTEILECEKELSEFANLLENNAIDSFKYFCLVAMIFLIIFTAISVSYFLWYRTSYYELEKRNLTALFIFVIAGGVFSYTIFYRNFIGAVDFDCDTLFISLSFMLTLFIFPPFIRLIHIVLKVRFNKALIENSFDALSKGTFLDSISPGEENFVTTNKEKSSKSPEVEEDSQYFLNFIFCLFCVYPPQDIHKSLKYKYFWATKRVTNFIAIFVGIILSFLFLSTENLGTGCTGCAVDNSLYLATILVLIFTIPGFIVLYLDRKTPDGLGVKKEVGLFLGFTLLIELIFVPFYLYFDQFENEGKFSWASYAGLQYLVGIGISFPYQVYLAKKNSLKTNEDKTTFNEILNSEAGSKAFALYLGSMLCAETIYFLLAVKKFKNIPENETEKRTKKATKINERYIIETATFRVNVSHAQRDKVTESLNGIINQDIFLDIENTVISAINNDMFNGFKRSLFFQAYLGNIDQDDIREM